MNRREFILGSATLAAGTVRAIEEKTTDGGFAPVSWPDRTSRAVPVLPPGAHGMKRFASKCVGCALCAAACPSKCLRPSTDPRRYGRVELDFRHGWCKPGCAKCGEVCPAGAIEGLAKAEKRFVRVGRAVWAKDLCLRAVDGVECHACSKHCPAKAIKVVSGAIVVNRDACVGCGACEHYCPARPQTAIKVEGFEVHRETRPISETDLVAEMFAILDTGKACVIAKDGVIVAVGEGRGVKPMLEMLEKGVLSGAIVMDRICGRASAAICIEGGARKVFAQVMAESARDLLASRRIFAVAKEVVPAILNREKTGGCPMDAATEALEDPAEIVSRLKSIVIAD